MPDFRCTACGSINRVPLHADIFTCKQCGKEQSTPPLSQRIEDNSLNDMVLKPEEESKPDTSGLFNRFASFENARVYDEEQKGAAEDEKTSRKNGIYYTALSKMGGEDPHLYAEALEMLESIKGWEDADALAQECRQQIKFLEAREKKSRENAEKRAKKRKSSIIIGITGAVVLTALTLLTLFIFVPNIRYQKAVSAETGGDIVSAYEAFSALGSYRDSSRRAAALYEDYKAQKSYSAEVGETILFGNFEQDNNLDDGKEEIAWLVLDKKDDRMLLLSLYGLDCLPYHSENKEVTWENCSLRKQLNGSFYKEAFTPKQQQRIIHAELIAHPNPDYNTDPGNDTKDHVFLLSVREAEQYLKSDKQRRCYPTTYAFAGGASGGTQKYGGNYTGAWFLRTPGQDATLAAYVATSGIVRHLGYAVNSGFVTIRPAIWLSIKK